MHLISVSQCPRSSSIVGKLPRNNSSEGGAATGNFDFVRDMFPGTHIIDDMLAILDSVKRSAIPLSKAA